MSSIYPYKKDSLVVFSEGCYSNFGYVGHFKMLKDMTLEDMKEAALAASKSGCSYSPAASAKSGLVNQLLREGFLEEFDVEEIYLGPYGDLAETYGVFPDDYD